MQYHALALAARDLHVDLIGFSGVGLHPEVAAQPAIETHWIVDPAPMPTAAGARFAARAAARAVAQATKLTAALVSLPPPDLILMQTPPAIPAGPIAWLLARARGARFVLDWHNLGWTLLALKPGAARTAAGLRFGESRLARRADAHLCVSQALRDWLLRECGVRAAVLYDRPPAWFAATDAGRSAELRAHVIVEAGLPADRTVLIVSPTSWTADEDFGLLLDAVARVDVMLRNVPRGFPPLLILATGQGSGRAAFEARLAGAATYELITVRTGWVEPRDYPLLLASADAGLCLHRSSSGVDLPMKVSDMFGVGVPVLALGYAALTERVRQGVNGEIFEDADSLARLLIDLWSPGDAASSRRRALREGSIESGHDRWMDGWTREAAPTLI